MSYKLVLHAGPDLTEARPKANPLVRTPHPLLREKKESVNQFAKIGKLRPLKSSQSLLKCQLSVRLLLPSTQKR